jgi:hypothetical protein
MISQSSASVRSFSNLALRSCTVSSAQIPVLLPGTREPPKLKSSLCIYHAEARAAKITRRRLRQLTRPAMRTVSRLIAIAQADGCGNVIALRGRVVTASARGSDIRNLTGPNSGSLVTKRTDACVYSNLRYSRFITFRIFSNRPAKSRAFAFRSETAPDWGMGWAVIPTRQTAVPGACRAPL